LHEQFAMRSPNCSFWCAGRAGRRRPEAPLLGHIRGEDRIQDTPAARPIFAQLIGVSKACGIGRYDVTPSTARNSSASAARRTRRFDCRNSEVQKFFKRGEVKNMQPNSHKRRTMGGSARSCSLGYCVPSPNNYGPRDIDTEELQAAASWPQNPGSIERLLSVAKNFRLVLIGVLSRASFARRIARPGKTRL